jgi:hypothetical protein
MAARMASLGFGGKLYNVFTVEAHHWTVPDCNRRTGGTPMIIGLAIAIFVALIGWGANYFGWSDPEGKIQLALFTSFVLGGLCGYKSKD